MLENLRKVDELVNKYNKYILNESINFKNEYSVMDYTKTKQYLENLQDESRLLKVGIIGKVKAGKSSLLNSIIFDGEDVLPKAATPMTAALTEISYGEEFKFIVEYYTEDDYEDIKQMAGRYEKIYKDKYEKEYSKAKERAEKRGETLGVSKVEKKARNEANAVNEAYQSSYEQLQDIKKTGVRVEEILGKIIEIEASDVKDLQNKLNDYVGSTGKYTPFVKLSRIQMPFDSLKDLKIVDTPGVNDPIVSREEKTKQMLKECDVIFMITSGGASLSETDINLLDRVESKEGIKNVYIVISQIDRQLPLDIDESKDLYEDLKNLNKKMRERKDQVIEDNENLKKIVKGDVIITAAYLYSIGKAIKEKKKLDENMTHVLQRLMKYFPDYLPENDKTTLYENLMQIANISEIKEKIEIIRNDKIKIQEEKVKESIEKVNQNILEYINKLNNTIFEKKEKIENGDLNKIKKEYDTLNRQKQKMNLEFTGEYKELVEELKLNIKRRLSKIVQTKVSELLSEIQGSKSVEEGSYMVEKSGFGNWVARKLWGGGMEEKTYRYNTINTGSIKSRLMMLNGTIQDEIEIEYAELTQNWKKNISRSLISIVTDNLNIEDINERELKSIIGNVVSKVQTPKMFEKENLPAILNQSGTLSSSIADEYEQAVYNYVNNFNDKYRGKVDKILREIDTVILSTNPIENLINNLDENIKKLILSIENKEESLNDLNILIEKMKEVI